MAAPRGKRRGAVSAARRSRGNTGWYGAAALVVLAGVALVAMSRGSEAEAPIANKDHWHAAFGVNVCGDWLASAPEFHSSQSGTQAGVHSHGDGLIHIHPYVSAEAGKRATVGRFLEYGGWSADRDSFEVWDATPHETGDKCGDEDAEVRWSVDGEEQEGDISEHRPRDGEIVALALLPADEEIGVPPAAEASLQAPSDLEPQPGVTAPVGTLPTDTAAPTDSTVPGDTTASTDTTTAATETTDAPAPTTTP